MIILNLATLTILNIYNTLRHIVIVSFKAILQNFQQFTTLLKKTMDQQQDGGDAADEQQLLPAADPPPAMEQPMDEDVSDVDEDDADFDDDPAEENFSSDDEDWTSSYGSDSDAGTDRDPRAIRQVTHELLHTIHLEQHPRQARPQYAFQPLRLIKRNYKLRNALSDFPLARSGHRVIASNSNLYSLGGYNPRSALSAARRGQCLLFQELWCYNYATNRWKLLMDSENATNMPRELASNALAIHNNVLISHGGTGYPFGESCSNDCYVYTTGEKALVTRLNVTGDLPTAQYGPGIVIHNDYLYTIGGTTGFDYSCDVYRLNLITKVWENIYICRPEMRDDPEGRYRHEVVYDGQHIYVLGGGTSSSVYDLQRIPAFNLSTNRWDYFDTLPDRSVATAAPTVQDAIVLPVGFPKPRKCFSCVQHNAANGDVEAFITGGLQGDFTTYFADIWKLNLRTKQWTWIRTASLPKPLYFHSAAHSGNGCMYIFGGIEYNETDMRRRNDLYKMWMTIPKLSEMCWDAITYYNEDLYRNDRDTLLAAGIPEHFVQRVPMLRMSNKHPRDSQFSVSSSVSKRLRALE